MKTADQIEREFRQCLAGIGLSEDQQNAMFLAGQSICLLMGRAVQEVTTPQWREQHARGDVMVAMARAVLALADGMNTFEGNPNNAAGFTFALPVGKEFMRPGSLIHTLFVFTKEMGLGKVIGEVKPGARMDA